jgi:copper(I)-binding protein
VNYRRVGFYFLALIGILALAIGCGGDSEPNLLIQDVWARPAMAGDDAMGAGGMGAAGTGAVFMRIVNNGNEADRLVRGSTDVANVVEIHETVMEGEVMRMRMLPEGLEISPGGEVLLKPGSYHIMLIDVQRDLNVGDTFQIELEFEEAGTQTVTVQVREM